MASSNINNQVRTYQIDQNEQKLMKNKIQASCKANYANKSKRLLKSMTKTQQKLHEINCTKGASIGSQPYLSKMGKDSNPRKIF